ncbi:TPA: hypothetical protein ROY30_000550 [Bacillus cereus]|uniref:Group-specific protein n=2 Tax=Bacillus cereus group TaxID=86661 RepID=A0A2B5K7X8_9BACI|nr:MULTISPECIES: hypothetical protein [Bacillus]EJV60366.1 hypothetical protein IEO_03565 [Bacillus wiedmannii]MBG9859013.1 hypothetical protein [Bacillus wiedmannii]MCG3421529.1 hypothetical protein [Bacillus thuringiensis]MCP1176293.1 hypothetical protein [Bacillus sp. 1663tsa1]MCP1280278.1 hypothetical protein [Bacillus sp. S0635]
MKITLASFFHLVLWSGFSAVLLLSSRDKLHYKIFLFLIFLYLAYVIAYVILSARRKAMLLTCTNSMIFLIIYFCF